MQILAQNYVFDKGIPLSKTLVRVNPKLMTMKFGLKKLETSPYRRCKMRFDILNHLSVVYGSLDVIIFVARISGVRN